MKFDLAIPDLEIDGACTPDILIMVDASRSMEWDAAGNETNNCAESRWHIVLPGIEAFAAEHEAEARLGLGRFPEPVNGLTCAPACSCLGACDGVGEEAAIHVPLQLGAAALIDAALDEVTSPVCSGTPVGVASTLARDTLQRAAGAAPQYLLWIADGGSGGDPDPDLSFAVIGAMALQDVPTFVVGFGETTLDHHRALLNNIACAGQRSVGFPAGCAQLDDGTYVATDPEGDPLYLEATDANSLNEAFETVIGDIDCIEG